jgi:hypothetical protein
MPGGIAKTEVTIAAAVKQAGYTTMAVGTVLVFEPWILPR